MLNSFEGMIGLHREGLVHYLRQVEEHSIQYSF